MEYKVHFCVEKSPSLASVLSQINPVHTFQTFSLKVHFDIILSSESLKWTVSYRCPLQNTALPHICYMPYSYDSSWFIFPNYIWQVLWNVGSSLYTPVCCHVLLHMSKYLPKEPSHECHQCVFFHECERPSFTPIQIPCKIVVLYFRLYLLR